MGDVDNDPCINFSSSLAPLPMKGVDRKFCHSLADPSIELQWGIFRHGYLKMGLLHINRHHMIFFNITIPSRYLPIINHHVEHTSHWLLSKQARERKTMIDMVHKSALPLHHQCCKQKSLMMNYLMRSSGANNFMSVLLGPMCCLPVLKHQAQDGWSAYYHIGLQRLWK